MKVDTGFMAPNPYLWPVTPLNLATGWVPTEEGRGFVRALPESKEELLRDSRWPAFFPSAISFVSTGDGANVALERVVGVSIVNRFPFIMAMSICRRQLSARHHARTGFMSDLERSGCVAVQFVVPGPALDRLVSSVTDVPDTRTGSRVAYSGLTTRRALTHEVPVFEAAYLVYEGHLVAPGHDFGGTPIFSSPWVDVGSHRVYFVEVRAIQLRADVANGSSQIHWQNLPNWRPRLPLHAKPKQAPSTSEGEARVRNPAASQGRFTKPYTPYYLFPSEQTTAFEADEICGGMATKVLPPFGPQSEELSNDRARWPCFFPCSAGMITTWAGDGVPNLMPCGSTAVVSRHPFVIAPCISYATINDRYAPRATLELIRRTGRFGCGVPFLHESVLSAIRYAGNCSIRDDRDKVRNAGLRVEEGLGSPLLSALPISFDCEVVGEVPLGTHVMFLGEVRRIRVRADLGPENPLSWSPWAKIQAVCSDRGPRPRGIDAESIEMARPTNPSGCFARLS